MIPQSVLLRADHVISSSRGRGIRSRWLRRKPRGHQVDLECLYAPAWPENVADDPHILVAAEAMVVALAKSVKVDRHGRGVVGGCERHRLTAKVNPQDSALDDQRRLWDGWRL